MITRRKYLQLIRTVIAVLFLNIPISEAKHSLWKITSGDHVLYLQGSVHCLMENNYPLDAVIEKAFSDSQVLVLEINMKEMSSPEAQQLMFSRAKLPKGQRLHEVMNAETWKLVKTICDDTDLPTSQIEAFKPWFLP